MAQNPGNRISTRSTGGPPPDGQPRIKSKSPETFASPGAGGGSAKKVAQQTYAAATMGSPTNKAEDLNPVRPNATKITSNSKGTTQSATKNSNTTNGPAEDTGTSETLDVSMTTWKASLDSLNATMKFCLKGLPTSLKNKLTAKGITMHEFQFSGHVVNALANGSPESIPAELLDEYGETLQEQFSEYTEEARAKLTEGGPACAQIKDVENAQEFDMQTPTVPVTKARFVSPFDDDMHKNPTATKRLQKLDTSNVTADEDMVTVAETLIHSIAENDVSTTQKSRIKLSSLATRGLSIGPSAVFGPISTCGTGETGTQARFFTTSDECDGESDGNGSLESSSDFGVRPRNLGKNSHTKDVDAQVKALGATAIEAVNAGNGRSVFPRDTFKMRLVENVDGRYYYAITATPDVYVKLQERVVANKRIRDAVLQAMLQATEKKFSRSR